jgi:hypothetical protein
LSNEINPPEVLASRDVAIQSKLRRNKKQQTNREHKSLKLNGNVDLGNNVFKQRKSMKRKKVLKTTTASMTTQATITTEHPNFISQVFHSSNHHRHNHNAVDRQSNHIKVTEAPTTQSTSSITSTPRTPITTILTTTQSTTTSTFEPSRNNISIQIIAAKKLEKVLNSFLFYIKFNFVPNCPFFFFHLFYHRL